MIPPSIVPISFKEVFSFFSKRKKEILEKKFSSYFKEKVLLTFSGRTALVVLLFAYGIKKDDEIILPSYGCPEVAKILNDLGFKLKFVDVDLDTYNISLKELLKKITEKTKVILAIHLFGNPCHLEALKEIERKKKIIVLEGAAQGLGGEFFGKKLSTISESSYLSLGYGKMMTTMSGGVILTKNPRILKRCQKILAGFKKQTIFREIKRFFKLIGYFCLKNRFFYAFVSLFLKEGQFAKEITASNFDFRFSERQTNLGLSQFSKLFDFNQKRRENVKYLRENLKGVFHPKILKGAKPCFLRYPIRFGNQEKRDRAKRELSKQGIKASITYSYGLPKLFNDKGKYPNTDKIITTSLMLPCHPLIKKEDLEIIARVINEIALSKNS